MEKFPLRFPSDTYRCRRDFPDSRRTEFIPVEWPDGGAVSDQYRRLMGLPEEKSEGGRLLAEIRSPTSEIPN